MARRACGRGAEAEASLSESHDTVQAMKLPGAHSSAQAQSCRNAAPAYLALALSPILAVAFAGLKAHVALAANTARVVVRSAGKLPVSSTLPLGVIATDPVLQQVLSQDFQVAGRLAGASATSEVTITVTMTRQALEPGLSLEQIARGDAAALALLQQLGVKPPPLPEQIAQDQDDHDDDRDDTNEMNAAEGNTNTRNDVNRYEQQGQIPQRPIPLGGPMGFPMSQWPVPPATAQERSTLPSYMQPYNQTSDPRERARREREESAIYETIFVAHASAGSGAFTVIAVAQPGFNAHEVRKLIAEEIANGVLH